MSDPIEKAWPYEGSQTIAIRGKVYNSHAAICLAENLKVRRIKMADIYLSYCPPCKDTLRSFVEHVRSVIDADMSYPIILNEDGEVIDGRHRLAKAMLEGHETIKVKRFDKDPESIWEWE